MSTKMGTKLQELADLTKEFDVNINSLDYHKFAEVCTRFYKQDSYPNKRDFTKYHVYKNGQVLATNLSFDEFQEFKNTHQKANIFEEVIDEVGYSEAKTKHQTYHARVSKLFRLGVLYITGILDHPKADKVFSMAWEEGHSSGFSDVASKVDDFADLLKD